MFKEDSSNISFSQKRTNFMESVRRKTRFRIINQKRTTPGEPKHGDVDLRHLAECKDKEDLIPKIKEFLELKPNIEDLVPVRKLINHPQDM